MHSTAMATAINFMFLNVNGVGSRGRSRRIFEPDFGDNFIVPIADTCCGQTTDYPFFVPTDRIQVEVQYQSAAIRQAEGETRADGIPAGWAIHYQAVLIQKLHRVLIAYVTSKL